MTRVPKTGYFLRVRMIRRNQCKSDVGERNCDSTFHSLIVRYRIENYLLIELRWISTRKARIAVAGPVHGSAHARCGRRGKCLSPMPISSP